MSTRFLSLLCALCVAPLLAFPVEAQGLRGLVRKKVEEAVKGPAKPAETPPAPAPATAPATAPAAAPAAAPATAAPRQGDPDMIELTPPVLAAFEQGLRKEISLREEFRKEIAALKTPSQYEACGMEASTSPEAQKISEQIDRIPDDAPLEERGRITDKAMADLEANLLKRCGADPDMVNSASGRAQRLKAISAKAAEAAVVEPPSGHLSERAYAMLKERVPPFCLALAAGSASATDGVTLPGAGSAKFLYTKDEVAALAPRCQGLMALLRQVE